MLQIYQGHGHHHRRTLSRSYTRIHPHTSNFGKDRKKKKRKYINRQDSHINVWVSVIMKQKTKSFTQKSRQENYHHFETNWLSAIVYFLQRRLSTVDVVKTWKYGGGLINGIPTKDEFHKLYKSCSQPVTLILHMFIIIVFLGLLYAISMDDYAKQKHWITHFEINDNVSE